MEYILACCILVIIILIYFIWNINLDREKTIERLIKQDAVLNEIFERVSVADKKLREIDRLGAFESDDEVGFFFKDLLQYQDMLKNYFDIDDTNEEKKEN